MSALIATAFVVITGCSKDDTVKLRNEQYPLNPAVTNGIGGTVFIAENADSSFNVTVKLNRSIRDSVHVMNIYNNDQFSNSNIALRLVNIQGTGGAVIGETKNIRQAVETTGNFGSVTYDKVLSQAMVIRVYLSESRMDSVLCTGFIGN